MVFLKMDELFDIYLHLSNSFHRGKEEAVQVDEDQNNQRKGNQHHSYMVVMVDLMVTLALPWDALKLMMMNRQILNSMKRGVRMNGNQHLSVLAAFSDEVSRKML